MTEQTKESISERGHSVWAEIDLGALRHNVRLLKAMAPESEFMGVVKSYAYGHGNPTCAQAMVEAGAERLGVARVAEGVHLRESGIDVPIHLFSEPPDAAVPLILDRQLTPTVYTHAFAQVLSEAASSRDLRVPVHLKVDTGMHRVGLSAGDVDPMVTELKRLPGLEVEGVWSHLAVADHPDDPFNQTQLQVFDEVTAGLQAAGLDVRYRHIANSAATMALPEARLDIVRCGIASYGLWPGADLEGTADLRPVMRVRARVNMVKRVTAGEGISYGLTYRPERDTSVITVGAGYADGYDRRLSNVADVLIRGRRYRVSGTVCMDQFMVDVGDEEAEVGTVVTLLGTDEDGSVSAEELADKLGTINYEVTARLPSRVPRIYVDGGS